MQVLTALGEFVTVFMPPEKQELNNILEDLKPPDFSSPSRKLKKEDIEQYWAQWRNLVPPEKDRFWDGMLSGLNNYLGILQDRDRLHDEVVLLRQRNAALRRLVRGTLPDVPGVLPKYPPEAPKYMRAGGDRFVAPCEEVKKLPPI
ncbi:unnamed protein product [Plutella xylostella]|uniref:(diamondback moth) hypothetical protein n=1 Tax=Plutella xylostella TaxID=51655 RepID=A0A8S4E9M2_PLUXY|nr:unnamed protein product [Plutella xylostella]